MVGFSYVKSDLVCFTNSYIIKTQNDIKEFLTFRKRNIKNSLADLFDCKSSFFGRMIEKRKKMINNSNFFS